MKIAVFTVCLPEYTPEEAAAHLREWGYDGVEWRVTEPPAFGEPVIDYWHGNRCTIDPRTIVEQAPNLRGLCRQHKLAMPVLTTYLKYSDLDLIERVMEAADVLGVRAVRVGVERYDGKTKYEKLLSRCVKGYEKVVALGAKYRVKPLAEIHMGTIIPSCSAARRFAEHFAPVELGIIHDAGNMVQEGHEQWQMGLEILGRYLAHVHVKNSAWGIAAADRDGNLRWRPAADTLLHGQVDWADLVAALKKCGYAGWLGIEDFSAVPTEPKLRDDLKYLRALIKG